MNPLRIAIVGYGIAGIAAAIRLRALGHRIEHFERRDCGSAHGAGLLLQPPTLKLLSELGVEMSSLQGAKISGFAATDLAGRNLTTIRYADHAPGIHGLGIQRQHLVDRMSALDDGRAQVEFAKVVTAADLGRGMLRFADGSECGPYDLIIAADGANSPLRQSASTWVRCDRPCKSAAVIACVDDPQRLSGDRLVQYFDTTRHVAVWPVGALDTDAPMRTNISISVAESQADSFRDSGAWRELIIRHCPHLEPLVEHLNDEYRPIVCRYRDVVMNKVSTGRLVFIGDAAHSMSPLLGQGARLALLDAATLAECLAANPSVAVALAAFDRNCRRHLGELQWLSRWLTPIFQSEARAFASLRRAIQLAQRIPVVAEKARSLLIGPVH